MAKITYRGREYPQNWKEISRAIIAREGGYCAWCNNQNGKPHHITGSIVVLTVHHLGVEKPGNQPGDRHDKFDCRDENLVALCQRCHLWADQASHIARAKETRRRKQIEKGQIELI